MVNVSVVIPAYNAEAYLSNAVSSVLGQSSENIRVVIVNDGSADRTAAIAEDMAKHDKRITVLHQRNKGVSCARNKGIDYILSNAELADGFIAFCDADDLWRPGCINDSILDEAAKQKADILGFSCWCTDQEVKHYYINNQYTPKVINYMENGSVSWLLNGPFCAHLYSAKLLQKYRLHFPENISRNEDVIFMRQAAFCATCIVYREETLYLYRTNMNSVTHQHTDVTNTMINICRAWHEASNWAKSLDISSEKKEAWYQLCLSTAATILLETASIMAEQGYGLSATNRAIRAESYYFVLDSLHVEQLAQWQQADLMLFRKNYNLFYWKHRIIGLGKKIGRFFLRISAIRESRDRHRFPYELKIDT